MNDSRPVTQYVPHRNRDTMLEVARQNSRNVALSRSPLPLSFTPASRHTRSRAAAKTGGPAADDADFYETFLKTQIDELQNKIDELDYEFISLTRHSLDLSTQVKAHENEVYLVYLFTMVNILASSLPGGGGVIWKIGKK